MEAEITCREPTFKHGLKIILKPTLDYKTQNFEAGALLLSESEAIVTKDIPDMFFTADWKTEMDSIVAKQLLDTQTRVHIALPKNTDCGTINITQEGSNNASYNIFITAEPGSSAVFVIDKKETSIMSGEIIRLHAQVNSKVDIITAQQTKDTTIFSHRDARIEKDAIVNWTDIVLGGSYVRSHIINDLCAEGATGNITVLFLASGKQQYDLYTASLHNAPETHSDIVTKGAVTDTAKVLSRGLVEINANAANSNGYEQQDALLLSKTAEADAIPNLVIHNHNVKCSHGSTVGQVDKEKLFYLMSRGLSQKKAERMLVEGFFNPVIEKFDETIQAKLRATISEGL
jgi:Fe-S cluster assembly protein SufD